MRKLIIDCDPGHDDAMAIMLALANPEEIDLLGIVTVAGNQTVEKVTKNALKVLTVLDKHVPVIRGADRPLIRELQTAPQAHGESGMDGPFVEEIRAEESDETALSFYKRILEREDKVTIAAIGPLTNIALLFRAYPGLKEKIECISLMGGSVYSGNITSKAEFNFYVDPEAAKIVYHSGVKLIQSGLEVTDETAIAFEEIGRFKEGGKASKFVYDLFEFYTLFSKRNGLGKTPIFDACAVMYLLHPEIFDGEDYYVDIETGGELTRGMSVADLRAWSGCKPNTTVLMGADRDKFIEYFITAIKRLDGFMA
ncbi:MAG: nucleoside hydrolase [Lachnospiraceae bacterium]